MRSFSTICARRRKSNPIILTLSSNHEHQQQQSINSVLPTDLEECSHNILLLKDKSHSDY